MGNWYMLTMVGKDRPGIVAEVSQVLFEAGGNLGEASMARLGGNFTVMLMLQIDAEKNDVENLLQPLGEKLALFLALLYCPTGSVRRGVVSLIFPACNEKIWDSSEKVDFYLRSES